MFSKMSSLIYPPLNYSVNFKLTIFSPSVILQIKDSNYQSTKTNINRLFITFAFKTDNVMFLNRITSEL